MKAGPLPDLSELAAFDARLREVPIDPVPVQAALSAGLAELERAADDGERARLLGYVATAERLLGRHADAIAHLLESVAAVPPGADRPRVVALIRLGEAYRCADLPVESERQLREALRLIDETNLDDLRDFALQHLGKCLVDAGRQEEATPLFEEALALRRAKGSADLVESTTRALQWARAGGRAT